jgi:pimeloyl-ACP methyl ester carboxylesterase
VSSTVESATEIRPFHVEIPDAQINDLRRRIAATRWPSKELVTDRSQGVQLETLQELARYWASDYDWRNAEAKLNALPQFTTEIDGADIHFIHVRSPHENAMPLIMTHGWPGSVVELLETVGPLTDPTAHGGRAEDAFHLVLPSMPGYGFSGEPTELGAQAQLDTFRESGSGYFLEMATRPQTIGTALLDSPVALAAWMLDHDTDSYYKISSAFVDGQPSGNLTRDHILDNITLYWLTSTGASAARSYWEDGRVLAATLASGQAPPEVSVPVGFTTFPGEVWAAPRSWVEQSYPSLTYFSEVDRGGHFAAWEEPELFSEEIRAAFRSLR